MWFYDGGCFKEQLGWRDVSAGTSFIFWQAVKNEDGK